MKRQIAARLLVGLAATWSTVAHAGNWPHFRGPNFNGTANETNLPVAWSSVKNVKWMAKLPGAAAATPIVWGDKIFLSSTDVETSSLKALCLDRRTGDVVWEKKVGEGIRRESYSNFASPTPATDGKRVVFFYGTGDLAAFDLAGKKLWQRNIQEEYGPFAFLWTFSTSPILFDGKLYMQVLQRDTPVEGRGFKDRKNESYLLALDPDTGKEIWRHVRPSEARAESREAFSTPLPYVHEGRRELVVVGGDDLTGHDLESGEELWRWGTWNPTRITHWRLVPSPVAGDGVILACAPKRDPIYAIRAGGSGQLNDNAIAWTTKETPALSSDVPTPAYTDGSFFVLSDVKNTIARVEAATGKVLWSVRTPRGPKFEASPLVADGKVYLINFRSDVVVLNADDGEILATNKMEKPTDDPVRSSVIAAGGNIFVRTSGALYCVGK